MLHGFKQFIARGNVIDLAVGVIIGAAVGEIVNSLVADLITPLIGMIGGQPDFSSIQIGSLAIGKFVNNVISFLIKAAALYFFVVVPFNRFSARLAPPPTPTEALLIEIRDTLRRDPRPAA